MLPRHWNIGLDAKRLRTFLMLFFVALTAPTAVLIWQAYSQLKWESFHQHRIAADGLARRIDARLEALLRAEDARSFADYSFIVLAGDPASNFVQRSPLSEYPVGSDVPGVLGFFQVDSQGDFSTPILPPEGADAANLGISIDELAERNRQARRVQSILADNRLVQNRPITTGEIPSPATAPRDGNNDTQSGVIDEVGDRSAPTESVASSLTGSSYSQKAFDELNRLPDSAPASTAREEATQGDTATVRGRARNQRGIGKVSDLQLDAELEQKSQSVDRQTEELAATDRAPSGLASRSKRVEQTVLPESVADDDAGEGTVSEALRISTFESEIDPFEFSLLDSGHIVLFRKVWRDNERFIQGLLLDQSVFMDGVFGETFSDSRLFSMSNLIVASNDDVIRTFGGLVNTSQSGVSGLPDGTLLYRHRLSAPLSALELIVSINRLPPGAGAKVLAWITLMLAAIFIVGFFMMYRLGVGQIMLSRQQQDFVSAVSHELKTPLTSIRMYGEMLKEGWADDEKRVTYYEYIHDESERLSKLIENVLQLSRISRNEPHFDLKSIEVGVLMSNIQSKISNQIERAGFELLIERDESADQAVVTLDEDCFAQIIINLVDNAIKFSKNSETKRIVITSHRAGDRQIRFSVRDHGPGVAKDQMKKIFRLFYRSESELTRETVGTGIGLAIVHQLTQAMGGAVDLVNAEPGAEFRILMPVTTA